MQSPSSVRFPSPQIAASRAARQGPWAGRRPLYFVPGEYENTPPVGRYFARLAECETASVVAYRRFAAELLLHGAPPELVAEAQQAERQVVQHAHMAQELAERFGVEPITPLFGELAPRGLMLAAIDNAVEGCIRQTYGALVVSFQAKAARDLVIRNGMISVAPEKRHHAALSWRAGIWFERKLSEDDVGRLRRAEQEELAALGRELDAGLSPFETSLLGLPVKAKAVAMLERLTKELWAAAEPGSVASRRTMPPRLLDTEPPVEGDLS